MHPSYYTNERYKKIYKTVLQDDKQEPSDDEEKDTVRRDETGIPLSNQILQVSKKKHLNERGGGGGLHSIEVAFLLLAQQPQL